MNNTMTSLQRVLTTLRFKEPDRVPLLLLLTMHGAKELGLSIKEYFSEAENVVKGQLIMQKKYCNDCFFPFYYAALEFEAWGGDVIYSPDGPPNSGRPFITEFDEIDKIIPPSIKTVSVLEKALKTISLLKNEADDTVPIIGTVMSPFSVPVMQMGFEKYLDLIYSAPDLFNQLMQKNETFCVEWANAQLEAGASVICCFDPFASPTIIPRSLYLKKGFELAKRTISRINGPTVTHLASGRSLPVMDLISQTGTRLVGTSCTEDLREVKKAAAAERLPISGNLNGIEMRNWTPEYAEEIVKQAIASAGEGGGFILSDAHGEIPYQVPEKVLLAISEAVSTWGTYPLNWIDQ